jgi:hypothetical protein
MGVPNSKSTLDEGRARCRAAIDTLLEHRDYIGELDDVEGWRVIALSGLMELWGSVEKDDEVWFAIRELTHTRDYFDADLCRATIKLLAAADRGYAECESFNQPLSLRTFEQLREAADEIGAALDKVRERHTATCAMTKTFERKDER